MPETPREGGRREREGETETDRQTETERQTDRQRAKYCHFYSPSPSWTPVTNNSESCRHQHRQDPGQCRSILQHTRFNTSRLINRLNYDFNCCTLAPRRPTSSAQICGHIANIAFRHLPPNSSRIGYALKGTLYLRATVHRR